MGFYEELSNYYDIIFPPQPNQLKFLTAEFQRVGRGKEILDVACANGGYSFALAAKGFQVVGFDLEEKMIQLAQRRLADLQKSTQEKPEVQFAVGDMRYADSFGTNFQGLFCIGNSLAHITAAGDLEETVKGFYQALAAKGVAVVQVVNFDRVVKYGVDSLPTIKQEKASLVRNYVHLDNGLIDFQTILTVKKDAGLKEYHNTVQLKPLLKKNLQQLFMEAGFKKVDFYGGFDRIEHSDDSPATILVANK